MRVVKIALITLAAILAFPVAFLIFYSIQAGCFLCLEGEAAGSWQESALNLVLLLVVVSGLFWTFIAKKRRQENIMSISEKRVFILNSAINISLFTAVHIFLVVHVLLILFCAALVNIFTFSIAYGFYTFFPEVKNKLLTWRILFALFILASIVSNYFMNGFETRFNGL